MEHAGVRTENIISPMYQLDRHAEKPVLQTQPLVRLYVVGLPGETGPPHHILLFPESLESKIQL